MKKIVALVLSAMLILSLSACSSKKSDDSANTTTATTTEAATTANTATSDAGQYKDGVYTQDGEKSDYGYNAVEVTVESGKISKVVLKRMNPDGTEVNYDEWTGVKGSDGSVKPNLKQFREDMSAKIIEKQSAEGIDSVSGATETTKAWVDLTTKALESAK